MGMRGGQREGERGAETGLLGEERLSRVCLLISVFNGLSV